MDAEISCISPHVSQKKGTIFCTKIHPENFSFSCSACLFSCLWSTPCLGPCPTEPIQACQVFEINGSSAGEQGKLRNGTFVILTFAP